MKQTAVDWLVEQLVELDKQLDGRRKNDDATVLKLNPTKLFEQAKEMEKANHEKFNKFLNDEKQLGISDLKTIERIQWYYNTYFNETFNTNEK
jgi:hypothetical protein